VGTTEQELKTGRGISGGVILRLRDPVRRTAAREKSAGLLRSDDGHARLRRV